VKYKIIIVDDHKIFREGFKLLLKRLDVVEEVHEAINGNLFLELLKDKDFDLVFLDINMPVLDGKNAAVKAREMCPELKMIVLSAFDTSEDIQDMLLAGVDGYLLKDAEIEDVEKAITKVMNGGNHFSEKILLQLTKMALQVKTKKQNVVSPSALSKREKEILQHVCRGLSRKEIAEKLFISERTVDKHKESMHRKTNTRNDIQLFLYATDNKLIN